MELLISFNLYRLVLLLSSFTLLLTFQRLLLLVNDFFYWLRDCFYSWENISVNFWSYIFPASKQNLNKGTSPVPDI